MGLFRQLPVFDLPAMLGDSQRYGRRLRDQSHKALGSSGELGISVATNRSNNRNNQRGRRIGTPFLPERPILTGQQTSDLYAEPGAKVFFWIRSDPAP
jgi:hypothetical protein